MTFISQHEESAKIKVSVVGAGTVGMATCFAIACQVQWNSKLFYY